MTAGRFLVDLKVALTCKAMWVTFPISACLQNIHQNLLPLALPAKGWRE